MEWERLHHFSSQRQRTRPIGSTESTRAKVEDDSSKRVRSGTPHVLKKATGTDLGGLLCD